MWNEVVEKKMHQGRFDKIKFKGALRSFGQDKDLQWLIYFYA